jgi:hypothetical protein
MHGGPLLVGDEDEDVGAILCCCFFHEALILGVNNAAFFAFSIYSIPWHLLPFNNAAKLKDLSINA